MISQSRRCYKVSEETYEFILCSVVHRNALSIKGIDTSGGDDGEGYGVVSEVGRSDYTRQGLADHSVGEEILAVGTKKLV